MDWSENVVWWHVYPLGFLGAERTAQPGPPRHRLPALAYWLGYLTDLGCNGLLLGPVFASETHGYDTVDHFAIDARLGTEDDLRGLVEEAAGRGIRVLLDGVFNHVGRGFGHEDWWRRGPDGGPVPFEGEHRLVTLDHANPAVADHVVAVMEHWLERGIDGWRLDVAYGVPLPFWREVTDRVRVRFPDAWFVGEVLHGDYAAYVRDGHLDSVTQYELWKAIWSSLNDGNLFELAHALERHDAMLATFAPMTFLGNHDVTRIASQLRDERLLGPALAVLMTVGGIPSLYSGDEQSFRGVKEHRAGGDDAVRPPFSAGPDLLAPYGWPTYRLHQELIGLRRRHPWLVRGRTEVVSLANTALTYTVDGKLLVALNLDGAPEIPAGWGRIAAGDGWAVAEPS